MTGSLSSVDSPLVEELREATSDELRAVARYSGEYYQLEYSRDDVDLLYSTEQLDRIFEDLVVEGGSV